MGDESDTLNKCGKRCKRQVNTASSSDSSDSGNPLVSSDSCRTQLVSCSHSKLAANLGDNEDSSSENDSTSSESEEEIAVTSQCKKKKVIRIESDYETGSVSGDSGNGNLNSALTDSSCNSTDNEGDEASTAAIQSINKVTLAEGESSSDSDGETDKCPICLVKLKNQEIGTPEACDHCFCLDCIQEWAKNVNTCPVDRQPFTIILVRPHLTGNVSRQIQVTLPTNVQEVFEDATFCEVCGLSDREERMLLCDSCDHGYHMECLDPPLFHVPIEEWYCPQCAPHRNSASRRGRPDLSTDVDVEILPTHSRALNRPTPRLVPRTRHSERVRTNLRSRQQSHPQQNSRYFGGNLESSLNRRQTTSTRRKTKRRRKTKSNLRIKRIVTDDGVIEVRLKKKGKRKYRRKYAKKSSSKTVKRRLANKLGMCGSQNVPEGTSGQELTGVRAANLRNQMGIPTLDILGRREQLDYFSGSDTEGEDGYTEEGFGVLARVRTIHPSERLIRRKKALNVLSTPMHKKPVKVENPPPPAGGSLLDSILDSQTLWHSKKAEIKSSSDGSLQVILPKDSKKDVLEKRSTVNVQKTAAPVKETTMLGGGQKSSGMSDKSSSKTENDSRGSSSTSSEQSSQGSSFQSSSSLGGSSYNSNVNLSPLRSVAPIRFRMNAPLRRPNIHSYPRDNIPPPPPRLRAPAAEAAFTAPSSPEPTPPREEEEIDIYSDIEQENSSDGRDEKCFAALEPPPEPPFLMTMEPPPEPPAILMTLNDDASDDEATGLVIDDVPPNDVYDPCAVNSDDSSPEDAPLAKPPDLPLALQDPEIMQGYSLDSFSTSGASYNPELPTYSNTPIIGPLPRPPSHNSSDENEDECPNLSIYSTASMNIARRDIDPVLDLDIPIPPPLDDKNSLSSNIDIPLPEGDFPESKLINDNLDIPIPENTDKESDKDENDQDLVEEGELNSNEDIDEEIADKENPFSDIGGSDIDSVEDEDKENVESENVLNNQENNKSDEEGSIKGVNKPECSSRAEGNESSDAEDECSTQGDVLDLAIESEANLENNLHHAEEHDEMNLVKSPVNHEEDDEKGFDEDRSDGLVDITDEDMSVYDGQDNDDNLEKIDDVLGTKDDLKKTGQLNSDDDNSLLGGATSAVSAATINNSENIQTSTLPGLEGLETETISESEDVNFDELPNESNEKTEKHTNEDHSVARKKKKKKNRKLSYNEDGSVKVVSESLEFEEGEIVEDKLKQTPKRDKKIKGKHEGNNEVDENIDTTKSKVTTAENETIEKKNNKKKKEKSSNAKDKSEKSREIKEKTLKPGQADENVSWKKLSKNTKERNYRDGKEREEKEKTRENRDENLSRKDKRSKEKRKELERYNVRRLISEKPKQPKKDAFGRDISPSKSDSSLSPYRPPRFRSPLRTRNRSRSRTRSRSLKSRSRSRGRRRRSKSRDRVRSRDRSRKARSRDRSKRRSRSRKRSSYSRERRKTPDKPSRTKSANRTKRKSRSPSVHSKRQRSVSYSRSWTPSWSRSSISRSRSGNRKRSRTATKSRSRSWTKERNGASRETRTKEPPKNLTVIVTNKEAVKKKEKRKPLKKKDDRRKRKRGQSPAPSKEVFTSGDNILVSVNFKNANKNPEIIPATTPLLRESSKRKRDDGENSVGKKKKSNTSKKTPGAKKSSRLTKINEVARNAKPVAIIDLDLSPFREQTPSPKEVIVLSDSGDEGNKENSQNQDQIDRLGHNSMSQSMLSLSSLDHKQKNSSQPGSPMSSSFMLNTSGPKTPPEPHIKFSITTKPSQIRMLSNPLMEAEEEVQDENCDMNVNEILHKGPNTPPEPPPDLNTPASPPTTPYDPFDPTKSRSPSPQPRSTDMSQLNNTSREENLESLENDNDDQHPRLGELRSSTPPIELDNPNKTPEVAKSHSTPKSDLNNTDNSPKVSPSTITSESARAMDDSLMKPIQKLLAGVNKSSVTAYKQPEKAAGITIVISDQKGASQTSKVATPLKSNTYQTTPNKHSTPKSSAKHQLFSSSLVKQVPILGSLLPGGSMYTPTSMGIVKAGVRGQQNGDPSDDMDIDPSSPYSPGSSEGDDLFEPPIATPPRNTSKTMNKSKMNSGSKFDALFGSSPAKPRHGRRPYKGTKKSSKLKLKGNKKEEVKVKLDEDQLKILDDLPSSAVEMQVKDKFLKKLNRQERVVEEVKLVLKPHYAKKHVTKEEYKEILRRSVPKICHNKSGEINPIKIQFLVEAYVKKFRYAKKKTSGSHAAPTQNKPKPQKTMWS